MFLVGYSYCSLGVECIEFAPLRIMRNVFLFGAAEKMVFLPVN